MPRLPHPEPHQLRAGVELDAWIESYLFERPGRFVKRVLHWTHEADEDPTWVQARTWLPDRIEPDTYGIRPGDMPDQFSTNLAAGWKVWRRLQRIYSPSHWIWTFDDEGNVAIHFWEQVSVYMEPYSADWTVEGDCLPHALCLAAVRVITDRWKVPK